VASLLDGLDEEDSQGIWRKVAEAIGSEPSRVWAWLPVVRSAIEQQSVLSQATLRTIGVGIATEVRNHKDDFKVVSLLEQFEITDEQAREEVVRELVASERAFSAANRRSFVLGTADRLAGDVNGGGRRLVDQRLSELEAGPKKDKQVAATVKAARRESTEH